MKGVNDRIAGVIRHRDVMITGAEYQPPGSEEAAELLDRVFATLSEVKDVDGLVLATWIHWAVDSSPSLRGRKRPDRRTFGKTFCCCGRVSPWRSSARKTARFIWSRSRHGRRKFQSPRAVDLPASDEHASNLSKRSRSGRSTTRMGDRFSRRGFCSGDGKTAASLRRWRHAAEQLRDTFEQCARP